MRHERNEKVLHERNEKGKAVSLTVDLAFLQYASDNVYIQEAMLCCILSSR